MRTRKTKRTKGASGADTRPGWDAYFMDITHVVKRRGNCLRRQVGAVIVRDRRIISTGYNGTPSGIRNCFDGGCARCSGKSAPGLNLSECICAHAEENAIVQAAFHGVCVRDGVLYCTDSPCLMCAKMIISAGIREVVYDAEYSHNEHVARLFAEARVKFRRFKRVKSRRAGKP